MMRKIRKRTLLFAGILSLGLTVPVFGAEDVERMSFTDAVECPDVGGTADEEVSEMFGDGIPEAVFGMPEGAGDAVEAAFLAEGEVAETVTLDGILYEYMEETDSYCVVKGRNAEEIKLPKEICGKKITEIGSSAFSGCKKLKRISGENGMESITIRESAFEGCENLRSVDFPVSYGITVESNAFRNCPRISMFSVDSYQCLRESKFAEDAFDSDTKVIVYYYVGIGGAEIKEMFDRLRIFHTSTDEPYHTWLDTVNGMSIYRDPVSFEKDISYVVDGDENQEDVMVADDEYKNDITIGRKAFYGFSKLKNVCLTERVTAIETKAFYGCKNLEKVIIPENVTSIAPDAFAKSPKVVIYAEKGSYASKYAKKYGIACEYRTKKIERPVMRYEKGGYLKWNPILFADGYQIYKYDWDKSKYVRVSTIKDGNKCSYNLSGKMKRGETAYYKVRAYSESSIYTDKYSTSSVRVLVKKFPDEPKLLSVSNKQKNKLIVKWSKPKGAEWFAVYRAETDTSTTALKRIKTIKDENAVSYVDTTVKKGKKYYYCVKAFRKFGDATLSCRWYSNLKSNTCK